jgi:hypothetical protein
LNRPAPLRVVVAFQATYMNGSKSMSVLEEQTSLVSVSDDDPGAPYRRIFGWIALTAAGIWGAAAGSFLVYHSLQPDGWMVQLVREQFPAVILVPMSALASFCIVLLLRLSSGPLEFKAIGFEFRGATPDRWSCG